MTEIKRWMSDISDGPHWNRVFVQTEEYVKHSLSARARWLELEMTEDFLERIQSLTDLLVRENLLSIDILMPLSWNLDPNWEIHGDTKITVSNGILQFSGCVTPKNWPSPSPQSMQSDQASILHDRIHAIFIFGTVDDLVGNHRHVEGVAARDETVVDPSLSGFDASRFEKSVGLQMIDSAISHFRKTVNSYLIEKELHPLR